MTNQIALISKIKQILYFDTSFNLINFKTDSESAENSASNCRFKIFINHAGGVKIFPYGSLTLTVKSFHRCNKTLVQITFKIKDKKISIF
jgi:hypothetical protein